MAISFRRYVDITSGVGGNSAVRQRDLIGRLFTTNNLLPTKSFIEFDSLEEVGAYFGTSSAEYLRAAFYFGFISKNITRPRRISFARWVNAAVAPMIFGRTGDQSIASYTPITTGAFSLTLGGVTNLVNNLDFSAVTSLADVASVIQAKIRTFTGAMWTSATVTWDPVRKCFNLVGGTTGDANIAVVAGSGGNDVADQIGWLTGAILSDGSAAETVTDTLTASADASNNFGSFLFMPALSDAQVLEAATWNHNQNIYFQFMVPVLPVDAQNIYDSIKTLSGSAITLLGASGEYPEMVPMMILAATDYSKRNAVQNYMFQQFAGLTPSVQTTADAATYDAIRVNYYGRTQTAGQFIDFYQRGVLTGLPTAPTDQNVYANEQWLKDAAGAAIMTLLLSLGRVSANAQGRSQLVAILQSVIDRALFNGTISVGKTLNPTQKLYIAELSGDDLAWHQVQNIGYWLDVNFEQVVAQDSSISFKAVYTLIYSKDDAIRKVEGTHVLI